MRERTQNPNLKPNNTKQKRANSSGAGEKMHKPELVGQSTHSKSKLNKAKKTKGGAEGEKHCTNPMLVRQNTQSKKLPNKAK